MIFIGLPDRGNLKEGKLYLGEAAFGKAVFATEAIASGEVILSLRGAIFEASDLPSPYENFDDRYLQIGPKRYLGPSGGIDDYINHSCDPNSGLRISDLEVLLFAIRDIQPAEEIVYDYSTSMDEDEWELKCQCGSPLCRGLIQDFKKLPSLLKLQYKSLGVVPEYNLRYMKCSERATDE